MSHSRSTERLASGASRRRVVMALLALLAPAALAACGKKGTLRLPGPEDEMEQDELDEEVPG
jgi:predicted small lipoprotein YifL